MAKCGKCGDTGVSVAHVRACYGQGGGVAVATRPAEDTLRTGNPAWDGPNSDWDRAQDQATNAVRAAGSAERVGGACECTWAQVDRLRAALAKHVVRPTKRCRVGFFAVRLEVGGPIKFYRVKVMTTGRWAGRMFIDAKGGPEYYPVRSKETLVDVITSILVNPRDAAKLYADELGVCSRCNLELTDEVSRAVGMGPDCREM